MYISLNWIKDFVNIPSIDAKEIYNKVTSTTAEVEGVVSIGKGLEKVTIAKILEIKNHPNSDHLHLVTIDLGKEKKEIVCGAPNVKKGMKVAFAPSGTTLPNGITLEPKEIRGVVSDGMLCSVSELGIGDDHSGIWELTDDAPVGEGLFKFIGLENDVVIEIDNKSLTHRPDLWGHFGFAREFSAIYEKKLNDKYDASWQKKMEGLCTKDKSPVTISVDKDSASLGYFGISIENVQIKPSPLWMQARLYEVGLRPINNMVDIGNYVMLELGMPLHIFDREKIKGGKIVVRKAGNIDKELKLLDDEVIKLKESDTVVADTENALVLAGIMGGLESGVSENTKNIFIETANWVCEEIRKTSIRVGVRTDSSQRYEKTLDSLLLKRSLLRAAELVRICCPEAKVVGKVEYDGPDLEKIKKLEIKLSVEKISKVLGIEVKKERAIKILENLDFKVKDQKDYLLVSVPSYRATKDVEYDVDLIEEIGRYVGYDNIIPEAPKTALEPQGLSNEKTLQRKIQDFMVMQGEAFEVMTYPLIGEDLLKKSSWDNLNEGLKLLGDANQDADRMRPSLMPTFLEAIALNQKSFNKFKMFELGRAYIADKEKFCIENNHLIFASFDRKKSLVLETINILEKLCSFLQIDISIRDFTENLENIMKKDWEGIHPFRTQAIYLKDIPFGVVGAINPKMLSNFKIKGDVAYFILDLSKIEKDRYVDKRKYVPISKYPSAEFDCTVLVPSDRPAGAALKVLRELKDKEVVKTKIVDVFPLSDTQNAVTLKVTFLDREKTLSSDRIKELENTVVDSLSKMGFDLKK